MKAKELALMLLQLPGDPEIVMVGNLGLPKDPELSLPKHNYWADRISGDILVLSATGAMFKPLPKDGDAELSPRVFEAPPSVKPLGNIPRGPSSRNEG